MPGSLGARKVYVSMAAFEHDKHCASNCLKSNAYDWAETADAQAVIKVHLLRRSGPGNDVLAEEAGG
jgi:hypothetical protein